MSLRAAILLLALTAAPAAQPAFDIQVAALNYDLHQGGAAMPLCWGPVALNYDGSATVTIQAQFKTASGYAAGSADDLLSVRSGWRVDVGSASGLTVDGVAWTWTGPKRGDAPAGQPLQLTSSVAVTAGNALLALRQLCYANIHGHPALTKRKLVVTVTVGGTALSDAIAITPGITAMAPMLRFEPLVLHPPAGATAAVVDTMCQAGRPLQIALDPSANLPLATTGAPVATTGLDADGEPAVTLAEPVANGSWQFAVTVGNGTDASTSKAVVPVMVSDAIAVVSIAGTLPPEIALAGTLPDDLPLDLQVSATSGTVAVAVVAHPGALSADAAAGCLASALSLVGSGDRQLHLDRSALRAGLADLHIAPTWLVVALDFSVDDVHRTVPWIVHLAGMDDG